MANERRDGNTGSQGPGPGGSGAPGGRGPGGPGGGFGGRGGPGGPGGGFGGGGFGGGGGGGRGGPGGPGGGFGGRGGGPGGPGGFGGGGRGGPGGGRGRREDRGPVGFEGAALEFARAIDKPVLAADYQAQLAPLEKLATQARKGTRGRGLDELSPDSRGKALTALLRVMRQTKPVEDDAEKEALRKQVFATLAAVWASLGDERRAEMAKEEAGDAQIAPHLLAWTGEWDKVAALAEHEGRFRDAAKSFEDNDRLEDAARLYRKGGDVMKAIEIYTKAGNRDAVIEAAKELRPEQQEKALLDAGLGDVLMDLLVGSDRWEDVGRLYERAEQWADAARAYEKVGRSHKAIRAWEQAGEKAEADRLIEIEVQERLDANDKPGAARLWARFARPEQAAALATDPTDRFRWLREAGKIDEAKEVAREELGKAQEASRGPLEQAPWMARAGDTANALRIYDEHRKPEDAAALFEELEDWELAARCHEMAGKTRKAAEMFERAGNTAEAERLRAAEPPEQPKAPRKPGGGGGAGRGGAGRGGGGSRGGRGRGGAGGGGGGGARRAPRAPQG